MAKYTKEEVDQLLASLTQSLSDKFQNRLEALAASNQEKLRDIHGRIDELEDLVGDRPSKGPQPEESLAYYITRICGPRRSDPTRVNELTAFDMIKDIMDHLGIEYQETPESVQLKAVKKPVAKKKVTKTKRSKK